MGWYTALALPSPFIFRHILARIVLPIGKVGEAVVLEPGADLLHMDSLQLITGAGFHLGPQH